LTTNGADVSVITSGHDVADARLHRIVAALVRAGLAVDVVGIGNPDDGPQGASVQTTRRGSLPARGLRAVTLPWRARGAVVVCLDPDVAIGCMPARFIRRNRLVVDVHEDYEALLADRAWATGLRGWLAGRVARLASVAAARADITVVADEHVPPPEDSCRERLVIRNQPDLALMAGARGAGRDRDLRAVYVGDVRRSRGLDSMVEALALAPAWTLDIVGPVSRADALWLEERLKAPDLAGRVRVHGRRPPAAAWEIAGGAQVGLALLGDTPAFRAAMPTKVSEYLAAGMAVVATPLPRVESLLAESKAGAVVPDAREAGAVLRRWAEEGAAELDRLRAAARAWSDDLVRDRSPYDVLAVEVKGLVAASRTVR
jgi:glycosyltransferase involved in cell wall biosynthesis